MGCEISSLRLEENGVISSVNVQNGYYFLDEGQTIAWSCPVGTTLTDGLGAAVPNGVFDYACPDSLDDIVQVVSPDLDCVVPTRAPTRAPAMTGTNMDSDKTVVVHPVVATGPSYSDCNIPAMTGVLGFQGSTNEEQVEIARYPLSQDEANTAPYYHLEPQDTITFVCQDTDQAMKIHGVSLQPHSVNFYTYTCLVEDHGEEHDFTIPLTCGEREEQNRRGLRHKATNN